MKFEFPEWLKERFTIIDNYKKLKTIPYSMFKHGMRVTCTIDGTRVEDARISIDGSGRVFICQNEINGFNADEKFGYRFSWKVSKYGQTGYCNGDAEVTDIVSRNRSISDGLLYGDIIEIKGIGESKVLAVVDEVVFISNTDNFDVVYTYYSLKELIECGYTLKQDKVEEEITELTLEEIAKLKGVDVSKIRIKE